MLPRPSRRLIVILVLGVLPAAFAGVVPAFAALAVSIDVLALLLFVLDVRFLCSSGDVRVRRTLPARVSRRTPFSTKLEIHNVSQRAVALRVIDRLPAGFEPATREHELWLLPGQELTREDSAVATERGTYAVQAPVAERKSPLGLGSLGVKGEGELSVAVLPDTRALGQFDALIRQRRLHEMGLARARERGQGTEIVGLRPYVAGDALARIDWKATARRGTPISREMHTERRQNVIIVLDCGRRMARQADGQSRLDHAVEAALLLSHVALRSDDRVGLLAFADRLLSVVKPVRGRLGASTLAQALFALTPVLKEPPYQSIAASINRYFPRRSLVVFFTDAIEPSSLDTLAKPLAFLGRRHLVLCVIMEDAAIERSLRAVPADAEAFFRAGAASELLLERERGLMQLKNTGTLLLEAPLSKLSTRVINRYLEVKARRLL